MNSEKTNIKNLLTLIDIYHNENIKSEQKKFVKHVIQASLHFSLNSDTSDVNCFDDFFESCREDLDMLIGSDDVEKAIDLAILYNEHFGALQADGYDNTLRPIYEKVIESLIQQIIDYGVEYDDCQD